VGLETLAEDPAGVLADPVSVLLVADAENPKQDDLHPENQDLKQLQELYDLMQKEALESVELQDQDTRIRLQRARHTGSHDPSSHRSSASPPNTSASESASPDVPANVQSIPTPLAGVFYRSSAPTSAPYAQEGSVVEPGQTLCIIEAMKVMNEIKAESRCRILKILAENSRPVAAGQALFLVEPA
jgi:acetyl-CoA carboxylase biotin carboxyl carrier protein